MSCEYILIDENQMPEFPIWSHNFEYPIYNIRKNEKMVIRQISVKELFDVIYQNISHSRAWGWSNERMFFTEQGDRITVEGGFLTVTHKSGWKEKYSFSSTLKNVDVRNFSLYRE